MKKQLKCEELEDRVLHKGAWDAKLLGTLDTLVSRSIKRSNFHSPLALKGLNKSMKIVKKSHNFHTF